MNGELFEISDIENEYNNDGQLVRIMEKRKRFGEDSNDSEVVIELEYNENGGLKKMLSSQYEEVSTIAFEYEYDEQDRPIAVMEYWNGSDELFSTTYKTYDKNGNVTKEIINLKGKKESENYFQHDEKGRVVKHENSRSDSRFFLEYKYEDYKDFTITRPDGLIY